MPQTKREPRNKKKPAASNGNGGWSGEAKDLENPEFVLKLIADLSARSEEIDVKIAMLNDERTKLMTDQRKIKAALKDLTAP